jgi:hypothetical protein
LLPFAPVSTFFPPTFRLPGGWGGGGVLDYLLHNCNLLVFIALLNCNSLSRLAQPLGLPLFPLYM